MENDIYEKQYCYHSAHYGQEEVWDFINDDNEYARKLQRLYGFLDPLLISYPNDYYLTIGDGRGHLAQYISYKVGKVLATDLTDSLLKKAHEKGIIKEYKKENAENLSFRDNTFDFVIGKACFHHFPRPIVAIYEALRVSRKGIIIFQEALDIYPLTLFQKILRMFPIKNILRLDPNYVDINRFEDSGNYVYFMSVREIEKLSYGIGLSALAYKKTSYDLDMKRYEIIIRDFCCKIGLLNHLNVLMIIFKEFPEKETIDNLVNNGFNFHKIATNP